VGRFFLHAIGPDQPGIVARLASALAGLGCNIGDSRMTVLQGQFAVMLVLDAPRTTDGTVLEHQLDPVAEELGLFLLVRTLNTGDEVQAEPAAESSRSARQVVIRLRGPDHPGIVAGITEALSASGGNVLELATHVVPGPHPGAVIALQLELPSGVAEEEVRAGVEAAAALLGVSCEVSLGASEFV